MNAGISGAGGDEMTGIIRQLVNSGHLVPVARERFVLHPVGNCVHCGLPIEESHLFEFVAGGGGRPVTVLVHTGSGHERCEGRETLAERRSEPEGER